MGRDELYMQRAEKRASGMQKAADAAGISSERKSEAKSNHLQIPSALPQVRFILNELSIGSTLSTLAGKLQGAPKTRSRIKARAAYDTALRFVDRVPLTREESQKVYTALKALKRSLETLGESF